MRKPVNYFASITMNKTVVMLFVFCLTADTSGREFKCDFVKFDDSEFRISTPADAVNKRIEIIRAIWGYDHIPYRSDVEVTSRVRSPISANPIIARVDRFEIPVERVDSVKDLAYLFVPVNRNNRLILFCPGHSCTLKDAPGNQSQRIEATINGLLSSGFDVLSVYMPHISEDTCSLDHCKIYDTSLDYKNPKATFGLRLFLEPTIVSLNYLVKHNNYHDVSMVGLSGGGWTTNLIAAIDDRIRLSFSVAGSMPIYFRYGGSIGDIEQYVPQLYRDIAGYPDIYLLDCFGEGRELTQIFNRNDSCCFGEKQHDPKRDYISDLHLFEKCMDEKLIALGAKGHYRQVIDEAALHHQISSYALSNIILPGLNKN
jgi:hypothetical protein